MPRATIASRQLKNKDTGIDLFVLSFKEVKGLMTSTVYYQVVLVSNLACFKTPSHKESDVVQYSIEKQWSEFEELRLKVGELFYGTALPTLNKKSIIVNDYVLRERRNSLDQLLKFLASVPKMAVCVPLLEFLGVDSGRAKRFSHGEPQASAAKHSDDNIEEGTNKSQEPQVDVFEDNENDEVNIDLFDYADNTFEDEDLFGAGSDRVQVSMFEQQDMARELTEEDEKDFGFIPDAIITKREIIRVELDEYEDNSDLLTIEDDLDKLMTVDVGKKGKQLQQKEDIFLPSPSPTDKPSTPIKPSPALKPKPPVKPKVLSSSTSQGESELSTKPSTRPKPAPKPQPSNSQQDTSLDNATVRKSFSSETILPQIVAESGNVDNLDQDDIMKYLRENSAAATDDVDLFS